MSMVPMRLDDIAVAGDGNRFLVLLRTEEGEGDDGASVKVLPIVVDAMQAIAIAAGSNGKSPERPLTHDLMLSMVTAMGATVERVEVNDLRDGTYFATVWLERSGLPFEIDARPSDALALAVRAKVPIFVAEQVLETSALEEDTGGSTAAQA
jgi:bifunctional DNase/RNase